MNKLEFLLFLNDLVQEDEATYSSKKTRLGVVHQWNIGTDVVRWHEDALMYQMKNDFWWDEDGDGGVMLVDESDFETLTKDLCNQLGRTPRVKPQSGCLIL
jgi:hypothetical protein